MKIYSILLAFLAIINVVKVFATFQPVQRMALSTDAVETEAKTDRVLRVDPRNDDPDSEERGIADVVKKVATNIRDYFKFKAYIRLHSGAVDQAKTVAKYLDKGFNPDQVLTALKLHKPKNIGFGDSPEYLLWEKFTAAYKSIHPGWKSQFV
ncbi:putative RxLR effector [Phytophthora palmivora]|uniref:RxLR effector n=1 Tax=Phytophthora palmivora TaxID=4796 RepID=A0A2P4X9Y1_9STRA|nr:putative RxLR effector [Phytophthora palmivora]